MYGTGSLLIGLYAGMIVALDSALPGSALVLTLNCAFGIVCGMVRYAIRWPSEELLSGDWGRFGGGSSATLLEEFEEVDEFEPHGLA